MHSLEAGAEEKDERELEANQAFPYLPSRCYRRIMFHFACSRIAKLRIRWPMGEPKMVVPRTALLVLHKSRENRQRLPVVQSEVFKRMFHNKVVK